MTLDKIIRRDAASPEPPLLAGTVTAAPATTLDGLYVELDGLPGASIGPCRFTPREAALPADGDRVLVALDDQGEYWAVEWTPSAPATAWAPGDVKLTAAAAIPADWLQCDGALELRADYPALFAAIGTAYNTGGESGAQFRLPDLRPFAVGAYIIKT